MGAGFNEQGVLQHCASSSSLLLSSLELNDVLLLLLYDSQARS